LKEITISILITLTPLPVDEILWEKQTYALCSKNRAQLPKNFISEKLETGKVKYLTANDVVAVRWYT